MSAQDIKIVKEFNQWRRGGDDVHADNKAYPKRLGDALDAVVALAERADAALQEQEARGRVIEEQRRTIEALNSCIGGEGSTTTENIRICDEIERLRKSEREGWRYADELEQERKLLNHRVSELEGSFDGVMQEAEERGRRIESLSSDVMRLRAAIQQTLDQNGHLADGENCTLIVLKRALGIQQCKKCGADMQPGQAIEQTFTGSPDFIGGEVCTVSPGGPGKLIECSKCPECGWSVTA